MGGVFVIIVNMKYLLELLPAAAFLLGYFLPDDKTRAMYVAIVATIIASVVTTLAWRLLYREFRKSHVVSLAALLLLGGGSLLLQDKSLFLWKPTVVYLLFAGGFLVSQMLRRPVTRMLMSEVISMPDTAWNHLNTAWILFFLLMAGLNLVVAWSFSEEVWVMFKIFGATGLMIIFMLAQLPFLSKMALPASEARSD